MTNVTCNFNCINTYLLETEHREMEMSIGRRDNTILILGIAWNSEYIDAGVCMNMYHCSAHRIENNGKRLVYELCETSGCIVTWRLYVGYPREVLITWRVCRSGRLVDIASAAVGSRTSVVLPRVGTVWR